MAQSSKDFPIAICAGKATLVGGTVTVTVGAGQLTANSNIKATRNTPGGGLGNLSVPDASRNVSAGTFVINSDSGTETSTVDWIIHEA